MSGFYMPHDEASATEANVKASIVARAERIWDDVYATHTNVWPAPNETPKAEIARRGAARDAADDAYQAYIAEQIKASGY